MVPRAPAPLLLAAVLLAAASSLPARGAGEGADGYAALLSEAKRISVVRLRSLGDWCARHRLPSTAREFYQRALSVEPEDAGTRHKLGYRKAEGGWERDPAEALAPPDDPDAEEGEALERRRRFEGAPAAAAWTKVAEHCVREGREEEALAAWREVLYFDPASAPAREALGHIQVEGRWHSEEQFLHREFLQRVRAMVSLVEKEEVPVRERQADPARETATAVPLAAVAAGPFVVETNLPGDAAADFARTAVRTERLLGRLFGDPRPSAARWVEVFVVLDTPDPYRQAVERLLPGSEPGRDLASRLQGWHLPGRVHLSWDPTLEYARDRVAHKAAESFLETRFPGCIHHRWLQEGFAFLGSGALLGTTTSWCVAPGTSAVRRGPLLAAARWPAEVRSMVARGEDPPLTLVVRRTLNDHDQASVAKAWSVLGWLLETRSKALPGFLEAVGRGKPEEEAARAAFGMDLEEMDRRWREWVREVL